MKTRLRLYIMILLMLFVSVDIANANTGNPKVDWLIEKGYVKGDARGYRLYDRISRAEAAKMVVEAGGLGEDINEYKYLPSKFKDINSTHWAHGYLNVGVINQLVNGYPDGTFRPSDDITYAEVIKMLVMANGDIPNTDLYSGPLWAVPDIGKAGELGITEGVDIPNHYEKATRERVFELVFNTMFKEEPIVTEEYKGIVVENQRVSRLKENQVSLVVFDAFDYTSKKTAPRYKVNDKITITVPKDIEDVEYLLGKVIDITIDNNNVVTELKEDSSYSYLEGPLLAKEDEVYLGSNGKYYDVNTRDRSSSRTAKLHGLYHNDESYDFDDFLDDFGDYDDGNISYISEFANITVKNGVVVFIDSFSFDDIAPVSEVDKRGSQIYVFDDSRNGSSVKVSLDRVVSYTPDWGFENMEVWDIKESDILHFYNRYSAIVRRGPRDTGSLNDIFEESGFYFAEIDKDIYQVRVTKARMPVFTINGRDYYTLDAERPIDEIYDLLDQQVRYILDINGHLQYIEKR